MIAIVDYGVGNLFSLRSSLAAIGVDAIVTGEKSEIKKADRIILPGVGAFSAAVRKLKETGLFDCVKEEAIQGKPLLGICLGMQMLFEKSFEGGESEGLGLLKGEVRPISDVIPKEYKVPHIGWNALTFCKDSPLFRYIKEGDYVYFVHSYFASHAEESVTATAFYGAPLTASVGLGNIFGCQFHPEKSGEVGFRILRAFAEIKGGRSE